MVPTSQLGNLQRKSGLRTLIVMICFAWRFKGYVTLKRFLDVCVGSPSRIHDWRVLFLSPLSDELPRICQGKFHLLGDAAYLLHEYLLTPFKDYGNLSYKDRNYNVKHSQICVKIENSFGLLKQRFRQLTRLDYFHVELICNFVIACCTLHNMCIDQNNIINEDKEVDDPPTTDETRSQMPTTGPSGSQNVKN